MPDNINIAVQKIQELLEKKKGHLFVEFLKEIDTNFKIEPVDNDAEEQRELNCMKIKTNTVIDEIIGGGIPEGKSVLLYGEFGSGKTQTCFTALSLCQNSVVYVDPEDSFNFERMMEICKARNLDYAAMKKRLILYKPKNWVEQLLILQSIPAPTDTDKKIDLIICDSLVKHFRGIEFFGRSTLPLKTGLLREFIVGLEQIAKMHRAALMYTSQVTEKPVMTAYSSKADTQSPIGGHSVEHQPDFVLFYRKGSGNIRVVRMIDSSHKALAEKPFVINEKGIDDLPPEAKAAKNYEKGTDKFDDKQHQEEQIGRGTKGESDETEEQESE